MLTKKVRSISVNCRDIVDLNTDKGSM